MLFLLKRTCLFPCFSKTNSFSFVEYLQNLLLKLLRVYNPFHSSLSMKVASSPIAVFFVTGAYLFTTLRNSFVIWSQYSCGSAWSNEIFRFFT